MVALDPSGDTLPYEHSKTQSEPLQKAFSLYMGQEMEAPVVSSRDVSNQMWSQYRRENYRISGDPDR